jgi:hypothetical protein
LRRCIVTIRYYWPDPTDPSRPLLGVSGAPGTAEGTLDITRFLGPDVFNEHKWARGASTVLVGPTE